MITCYLRYKIDMYKVAEFEKYARMWIPLVERFGGQTRPHLRLPAALTATATLARRPAKRFPIN